jgi:hypothetical protein
MPTRNLNPQTFFDRLAADHKPRFAFGGRNKQQFEAWKSKALPQALATLGSPPARVPRNEELLAEWREDGLVKQRWVIDVQPGLAATLLIFRPENLARGEKRPALLCCHGHGPLGKDGPMGLAMHAEGKANVAFHNYDYGLQMAKAGFVTYSLDWLGFGERAFGAKPHFYKGVEGRDPCNVLYLCATMLGTTMLAMNCSDASIATDFVCEQPYVDPRNLGVMGLSLGGTMTTWMALYDKRFKAADIMCYAGPFREIAYRTYNVCGSQVTPGIFDLVDVAELQALIAPRPLLYELGLFDSCFEYDYTRKTLEGIRRIYKAAGVEDRLEEDVFPGEHAWGGNRSVGFFRKWLGASWA